MYISLQEDKIIYVEVILESPLTIYLLLRGGNRNTGTTAKRPQRGAAVATVGVQV